MIIAKFSPFRHSMRSAQLLGGGAAEFGLSGVLIIVRPGSEPPSAQFGFCVLFSFAHLSSLTLAAGNLD